MVQSRPCHLNIFRKTKLIVWLIANNHMWNLWNFVDNVHQCNKHTSKECIKSSHCLHTLLILISWSKNYVKKKESIFIKRCSAEFYHLKYFITVIDGQHLWELFIFQELYRNLRTSGHNLKLEVVPLYHKRQLKAEWFSKKWVKHGSLALAWALGS